MNSYVIHTVITPCLYNTDVVYIACIEDSIPAELSESDCFCIEDDRGNKICNPQNCDDNKRELSVSCEHDIF